MKQGRICPQIDELSGSPFDTEGVSDRIHSKAMTEKQANQPVFQTPNPEELKKAAQEDPIHERECVKEAEVAGEFAGDESEQMGREASEDMANSQTTIANLGGH